MVNGRDHDYDKQNILYFQELSRNTNITTTLYLMYIVNEFMKVPIVQVEIIISKILRSPQ
jgi:hypothetical protein